MNSHDFSDAQDRPNTGAPRVPPGAGSFAAAYAQFVSHPCDIDTFDALAQAVRSAAAALRGADNANNRQDAQYLVDFAREAIERGENALDVHIAGRA